MAASACAAAGAPTPDGSDAAETTVASIVEVAATTGVPTMRPTSAEKLGIVLDPEGRPYDVEEGPDGTVEWRLLTRLRIDRGQLEIVAGELLYRSPPPDIADTESVRLATDSELELRLIWHRPGLEAGREEAASVAPAATAESILGVHLAVPGSRVARWGRFEPAYTTTEGLGAVTSRAVLASAAGNDDALVEEKPVPDRPFVLADLDDRPGNDLFLFSSGDDEGPVVAAEGFDAAEKLVAVMLWHPRYPWRLAVRTGSPPPDVVEREQQLLDCIEGRRLIDRWGRCT